MTYVSLINTLDVDRQMCGMYFLFNINRNSWDKTLNWEKSRIDNCLLYGAILDLSQCSSPPGNITINDPDRTVDNYWKAEFGHMKYLLRCTCSSVPITFNGVNDGFEYLFDTPMQF